MIMHSNLTVMDVVVVDIKAISKLELVSLGQRVITPLPGIVLKIGDAKWIGRHQTVITHMPVGGVTQILGVIENRYP